MRPLSLFLSQKNKTIQNKNNKKEKKNTPYTPCLEELSLYPRIARLTWVVNIPLYSYECPVGKYLNTHIPAPREMLILKNSGKTREKWHLKFPCISVPLLLIHEITLNIIIWNHVYSFSFSPPKKRGSLLKYMLFFFFWTICFLTVDLLASKRPGQNFKVTEITL